MFKKACLIIFTLPLVACDPVQIYEYVKEQQLAMMSSYEEQKLPKKRELTVSIVTLNTFLLNFFFIGNKHYRKSLKLYNQVLSDGRFFEALPQRPDFIAVQEFFIEKDLKPILNTLEDVGYISAFSILKSQNPKAYRRSQLGLDIWIREDLLKGKVYGQDYTVNFEEYVNKNGYPMRHFLEAVAGHHRGILHVDFKNFIHKKNLTVATTHLIPTALPSWARIRLKQGHFISQWLENHPFDFLAFGGDFNTFPENEGENLNGDLVKNFPRLARSTRTYSQLISSYSFFDSYYLLYPHSMGFTYDPTINHQSSTLQYISYKGKNDREIKSIEDFNERLQHLPRHYKRRIDYNFFQTKEQVNSSVMMKESEVVFKTPFLLSKKPRRALFLSDHFGVFSSATFQYEN